MLSYTEHGRNLENNHESVITNSNGRQILTYVFSVQVRKGTFYGTNPKHNISDGRKDM